MKWKKKNEHIKFGKEILENCFKKEEFEYSEKAIEKVLNEFNCKNSDSLFELVGSGSLTASSVLRKIFPELTVGTRGGGLRILRLKPEGKQEMDADSFLRGNLQILGKVLE